MPLRLQSAALLWPIDPELAEALLERETLNLEELTEILGERPFKTEEIRNIDKYQMGGEE